MAEQNIIKKYSTGLLIGRFQPFHCGHDYLIKRSLARVKKLIIEIGSSNIKNKDNPFGYMLRKKLLEKYLENEGLTDKVIKIVPLPDNSSDNIWLKNAIKRAGNFDVVISNNDDYVNRFFEEKGHQILRFPFYKRYELEGVKIRNLMRDGSDKWKDRIPQILHNELEKRSKDVL